MCSHPSALLCPLYIRLPSFPRHVPTAATVSRETPQLEEGQFMEEGPSRKLAVILHADVVGSTTLVQKDESVAHQRIQDAFQRLSETTSAYGGTAHEIRGDALVAEFSRASDAVCAAIKFQADNAEHNAKIEDQIRPAIRVGISLGEVVIADGTVTGAAEPVNDFETLTFAVYCTRSPVVGLGGLIQTASGSGLGSGHPRTKRSGCAAHAFSKMRRRCSIIACARPW